MHIRIIKIHNKLTCMRSYYSVCTYFQNNEFALGINDDHMHHINVCNSTMLGAYSL